MSILLKDMLQMLALKKNVIASMMGFGADSVKRLLKVFVSINVPGMDIVVVVFVRYTQLFCLLECMYFSIFLTNIGTFVLIHNLKVDCPYTDFSFHIL